uniref:unspecific monooxygenase n=1 Tax=Maruca vitrata TaxID=497515 RepID=A0AAU7N398_MARVT
MIFIALAVVAFVAFYFYNTRNFNYWKDRGVKHDKPIFLFGNNFRNYTLQKSVSELCTEYYWKFPNEKVVGFFRSSKPDLIVRDPEIIKRVLVTDFASFYPRGLNQHKNEEPLMKNLFFVDGDVWRLLRQRMTPAFTSGKLRAMFPLIVERAERLQARAQAQAAAGAVDARDLMARYTTDFIGACGFGLSSDSLNEEDSAFRKLGIAIFTPTIRDIFVLYLKDFFPNTFKNIKQMARVENEITQLVSAILKERNYEPSGRNDFIDLLLECRKKGTIIGESMEKRKADGSPEIVSLEMDDLLITAQVFVFFAAGFETSSSATSYTLHQLAYNQEVQEKVQKEIDEVLAKHENKLSYDAIKEMKYLEWTFKEGMRMFPSLGFLMRSCVGKYTIPEVDVTLDERARIFVPLQALHNDPKYFERPERFRPERFDPKLDELERFKSVYFPFGEGPRACIGERLGLMQSLAGLAAVLSRFSVEPAPETVLHPTINPASGIVQGIKGGLPLTFKLRNSTKL